MPPETTPAAPKPSFRELATAAAKANEPVKPAASAPATPPATPTPPEPKVAPAATPEPPKAAPVAAQPAAPATPPAVDPDEEILAGKRSPKADDFKRVKNSAKEARMQVETLQQQLAAAKALDTKAGDDKAAKLQKELDERTSKLTEIQGKYDAVVLQFTPEFQKKYDDKVEVVRQSLKAAVPQAEKIIPILELPEGEHKRRLLAEATQDMDGLTLNEIANANREIRQVREEQRKESQKATETLASIAESRRKQQEELTSKRGKAFETIFEAVSKGDKALAPFQIKDGDEAWNKEVQERSKVARIIFEGQFDSEEERAQSALMAAISPSVLKQNAELQAQLAERDATILKLKGANPGMASNPAPVNAGGKKKTLTEVMLENAVHG